jgi:putative ABC transport system permease protein
MKYLPLIGAGLARRPVHPILTAIAMAFAACLAALSLAVGRVLPPSAELNASVRAIAGMGFLLILFLTSHAVTQSVRERGWEFALLRSLGFPARLVTGLFFLEVASACLTGAALGLVLAQLLYALACRLLFKGLVAPFLPQAVVWLDLAAALCVAFASTALPAWRLARLNMAAALAKGAP